MFRNRGTGSRREKRIKIRRGKKTACDKSIKRNRMQKKLAEESAECARRKTTHCPIQHVSPKYGALFSRAMSSQPEKT